MEYTEKQIKEFEYLLKDLKTFLTLSIHFKNNLDTGLYPNPIDAINIVIDPNMDNSLMQYLVFVEDYENCQWLKSKYEQLIIQPKQI